MPKIANNPGKYLSRSRKIVADISRIGPRPSDISVDEARKRFDNARIDDRFYLHFDDNSETDKTKS